MDQRTVECLLRRLVERVEESERRYGEALDELHARLDRLSETTEAARETGAPEDTETFDRLQNKVGDLARRLEGEAAAPLDDFERLGRALAGGLDGDTDDQAPTSEPEPSPFAKAAMTAEAPIEAPPRPLPDTKPEPSPTIVSEPHQMLDGPEAYAPSPVINPVMDQILDPVTEPIVDPLAGPAPLPPYPDLDKRLVEMAERLEKSIDEAMPTQAIESLNARLDELASQFNRSMEEAPSRQALEHVEQKISDVNQQLGRAEAQLTKVDGVESHLKDLVERLNQNEAAPVNPEQLEEIANKAATDAALRVASDNEQTTERLDSMHRDLAAMSRTSSESGDRLVRTLEAVHQSLKQLVQQAEQRGPIFAAQARPSFMDRSRPANAKPATPFAPMQEAAPRSQAQPTQLGAETRGAETRGARNDTGGAAPIDTKPKTEALRDRLGAAIPDFKESDPRSSLGQARPSRPDQDAVDLDTQPPGRRWRANKPLAGDVPRRQESDEPSSLAAPDDLVAAARRAAQLAAARAEERGGHQPRSMPPGAEFSPDRQGRHKRSFLMITAAVLLALSAAILYGRLSTKPEADSPASTATHGTQQGSPAANGAGANPSDTTGSLPPAQPEQSGQWAPDIEFTPMNNVVGQAAGTTEIAKSSRGAPAMPSSELIPQVQPASLTPDGAAEMPAGVIFSVEEPTSVEEPAAAPTAPMPPAALGPLALRRAASMGDAAAQYMIADLYAQGTGTPRNMKAAAQWFERAVESGLAPAQYRLAAMYERGQGVGQDKARSNMWYAKAAQKGHVKAMHNLAVSVSGRDGSPADYATAAKWYGQAAAHGLGDSQFNLGILAEHGLGVPKNLTQAYKWFSLAANKGDADAAKRREIIRVQLSPESLATAETAIKAWEPTTAMTEANEVAEKPAWTAETAAAEAATLVARAQALLNKLGYDAGPADGLAGSRTRTAIVQFEQKNGLAETGEISVHLVTQLEQQAS